MWTNHNSYTLSPTLEIHLIYFIFCHSCHSWKRRWGYIQLWPGVCVVLSAIYVPVELVVLYVFDTSGGPFVFSSEVLECLKYSWISEENQSLLDSPWSSLQSKLDHVETVQCFFLSTSWSVCLYKLPAGVLKVKWRPTNVSFEGFTSFL